MDGDLERLPPRIAWSPKRLSTDQKQSPRVQILNGRTRQKNLWVSRSTGKSSNSPWIGNCYNVASKFSHIFIGPQLANEHTDLLLGDRVLQFLFCFVYLLEPTVIRLITVVACSLVLRVLSRLWLVATQRTFQTYFLVFTLLLLWQ